jgi:tripartite-type tricarboxylate transporter receptor subunit TctC
MTQRRCIALSVSVAALLPLSPVAAQNYHPNGLRLASTASTQSYPTRSVRIVVPVAPGGGLDTQGRLLSKKLQERMGQVFVIDNRPGASAMIGTEIVVRSPADGYTLLFAGAGLATAVTLNKNLAFDLQRDLAPVVQVSSAAQLLVVHPSMPARTVQEFVALAKRQAGKMNASSSGTGTNNHLALEMLRQKAGINVAHIPYKGSGPAVIALMSGEVDFAFAGALSTVPHVRSGRIRVLAVTTPNPSPAVPGVPTLTSLYPGFESTNWYTFFAPTGTPAAIAAKISSEIAAALKSPEIREFLLKEGADPVGSTPAETASFFKREVERYAAVIQAANIKFE